jgi:hypothetical protein
MEATMSQPSAAPLQTSSQEQSSANAQNKPIDKFIDGPVHVSIWENTGTKGVFRVASFDLRYKDKNDQWKSGHNYTAANLKNLESAAREARARIEAWQQSIASVELQP